MIELASKLATPVVLALAGTFYTAGYAYRAMVMRYEGLSPSVTEGGLQETMSQGLVPCALLFLYSALPVALLLIFKKDLVKRLVMSRSRILGVINIVGIALIFGTFAGTLMAFADMYQMEKGFRNGCRTKCFAYYSARGQIYGFMLFQGKSQIIIKGTSGVFILKDGELKKVVPSPASKGDFFVSGPLF